jgi:hypothetical protein
MENSFEILGFHLVTAFFILILQRKMLFWDACNSVMFFVCKYFSQSVLNLALLIPEKLYVHGKM